MMKRVAKKANEGKSWSPVGTAPRFFFTSPALNGRGLKLSAQGGTCDTICNSLFQVGQGDSIPATTKDACIAPFQAVTTSGQNRRVVGRSLNLPNKSRRRIPTGEFQLFTFRSVAVSICSAGAALFIKFVRAFVVQPHGNRQTKSRLAGRHRRTKITTPRIYSGSHKQSNKGDDGMKCIQRMDRHKIYRVSDTLARWLVRFRFALYCSKREWREFRGSR